MTLLPLFEHVRRILLPFDSCLDIGAGIKPQNFAHCNRHICIEPHYEYANVLRRQCFEVIEATAINALEFCPAVDTIFLLDSIEHMEKNVGLDVLKRCERLARKQIVVFTPLGFEEQEFVDSDEWEMHGGKWQCHRSGWYPEDFKGWRIIADNLFHGNVGAFFAICTL